MDSAIVSMRVIRRIAAFSMALGLTGCLFGDPARGYRVPNWTVTNDNGNGGWYERKVDPGVSVKVRNYGFGGTFSVTVDIINISSGDLSFDGSAMYVVDAKGHRLSSKIAGDMQCQYSPDPPLTVPPQGHIEARCRLAANLRKLPGDMTLIQNGLSLTSRAISVAIPMTD
jgi:hypothetical protein